MRVSIPICLVAVGRQDVRSSISEKIIILSRMPISRVESRAGRVSGLE